MKVTLAVNLDVVPASVAALEHVRRKERRRVHGLVNITDDVEEPAQRESFVLPRRGLVLNHETRPLQRLNGVHVVARIATLPVRRSVALFWRKAVEIILVGLREEDGLIDVVPDAVVELLCERAFLLPLPKTLSWCLAT